MYKILKNILFNFENKITAETYAVLCIMYAYYTIQNVNHHLLSWYKKSIGTIKVSRTYHMYPHDSEIRATQSRDLHQRVWQEALTAQVTRL